MAEFKIHSDFKPSGDQPQAINEIVRGLNNSDSYQTLLGVTGSGKTFTMANVIQEVQRPTLIMSHNKTLAAQLYGEFKQLFPNNAVEYFISYYDYYQPEAYLPVTDTFIEKDASVNEEIDKLRLKATSSLMSRKDVIVVSSVSCIYGIGSPDDYKDQVVGVKKGEILDRRKFLANLIHIHYARNDAVLERGNIRVRGDVIEVFPAYEDVCVRVELFGAEVEQIVTFDPLTGELIHELDQVFIYPAKHFVTDMDTIHRVIGEIRHELTHRLEFLRNNNKLLEAQRLEQRTNFDIEMMVELGYCSGIENYSRYFAGRKEGEKPFTLIDFFPDDFITILDESHVTLPQIQGMYNGDRARKEVLVEHGFRLPSALDNRPLKYDEFLKAQKQVLFTSATPSHRELELTNGSFIEQVIRPTGLLDPEVDVRETKGQIDDLIGEIRYRAKRNERVLITTLTKRMSEDLTEYMSGLQIRVRYLHSDINSLERVKILRDLRLGEFDALVGINLLREGLDLPEVSLVAVLDADKQGFLRSKSSLLQVAGRAARHQEGLVILYADKVSDAMEYLMSETKRRRKRQDTFNKENNIVPKSIYKNMDDIIHSTAVADSMGETIIEEKQGKRMVPFNELDKKLALDMMRQEMMKSAEHLDFERAAKLRDEIIQLEKELEKSFKE
ncbi:MAG: excinuclease ABC subunit UvrB [Candidatus Marinimicrobia bacterium]|jgi:excinuclease ABC subunit B|nr:excinuclease ABC subunit UvrB [Candidatus Neomarinimicrobiota bacterium]MBT3936028.1 excinuclease ABC subunit UvrB [Candidatus Neomarinimicrobiota bacterium]MBT3960477.1 excinuclease ABC subunit UvrB [Candidatus Neomarinimicrobiota bacterium]MBT4383725.1 excinuclease ABC subunit UvrB [Candidatus Neomarinimicrobiota bacterium]MBT4636249.1 excinuclease ABC subunit UvrB [Candidatus Neomarinimicrobiota bacterium]